MNNQIIKKLNDYYVICKTNHYKHSLAAEEFDQLYSYTTAPIIFVTALTTVFSAYNTINTQQYWIAICVTILSGITSISHSLATFFEFNKKYTTHYSTANSYMALVRLLENECLNNYNSIIDNDGDYIQNLFNKIINELNNIQKNESVLSAKIFHTDCGSITYGIGKINDVLIINGPLTRTKMAAKPKSYDTSNVIYTGSNLMDASIIQME